MPQPLRQWDSSIEFGSDAIHSRPLLAPFVVEVSGAWNDLALELAMLLAGALDTHVRAGVRMYLALVSTSAQEDVLSAAIEANLPDALVSEFQSLLPQIRARGKERNRIVHGIWGTSDKKMDALILCPIESLAIDFTDDYGLFRIFVSSELSVPPNLSLPSERFVRQCLVYKEKDFTEIVKRTDELRLRVMKLFEKAGHHHDERLGLARALGNSPQSDEGIDRDPPPSPPESE